MKKLLWLLPFLSFAPAFSQENDSIPEQKKDYGRVYGGFESNSQWYLNDKGTGINQDATPINGKPLRSNNYLLVNYQYKGFTAGIQAESYAPDALLNYNPGFDGTDVGTWYAAYKTSKLEITGGYFYEQFGSGMLLRAWEDRALGINTALRGGRVLYRLSNNTRLTALYGRQRTGFNVARGDIYGFDADFILNKLLGFEQSDLSVGASYVGRYEALPVENAGFDELTNAVGARFNFIHNAFYLSGEVDYKQKDGVLNVQNLIDYNFVKPGNAVLLNFGYSKEGLGIDATVRRTENFKFLSEREPVNYDISSSSLNYNDRVLNFTPALTKQHHSNLANIYVYQAQTKVDYTTTEIMKAGETGGQIDLFYDFAKETPIGGKYGTKLAVNLSSWYNLPGTYRLSPAYYETKFLGVGEKYFSDYNIEIRKQFSETLHTALYYIRQFYNKAWIEGGDRVNTNIVTGEATYNFTPNRSIRLEGEHMWADADKKNWAGATLELNIDDKYSFYVWDIYNYGNDNPDNRTHYYNAGGAYRIGATRIAANYGRQRGGLVCVGGVCRFVPESTGVSLQITTAF
ncbi:DUF6029 family protein [Flavobacterium sp. RHBU_24]|uniref:DUF6029 family protein n=1 Tax=Flavobacterium sp. RHBU_24 TaxID=3391185 RepID=UPI00398534FB